MKEAKLKAFSSELSFQGAELFSIILQESIHKKFFEICPMMQKMMLQPEDINVLTPRCRTPKVSKIGAFSQYLRVTTFWDLKIYTQKYMTLRDFDNFLFFP